MGGLQTLLAHGSGIDDLIVAALIVLVFILLARRGAKRRERGEGGPEAGGERPGGAAEPDTCLYCGEPVAPTDEVCGACGYQT